jgi:hypothetical protein
MNKFGVERTPLARNSKMVQKLDLEVLGSRHEIKSLRNIARSFKLFGSLHYTVQGIIA